MDKSFEKQYSINISRLKYGPYDEEFQVTRPFFEHFELSPVQDADIKVKVDLFNYESHLDVTFSFKGSVKLSCDRCLEPYDFEIDTQNRIFYTFDPDLKVEGYELVYADKRQPFLLLIQELYDFINLAIPIRKIPDPERHKCPEKVLEILGLAQQSGDETSGTLESDEIDPRWEQLKKLKEKPE